jgi:hypothetical protein
MALVLQKALNPNMFSKTRVFYNKNKEDFVPAGSKDGKDRKDEKDVKDLNDASPS